MFTFSMAGIRTIKAGLAVATAAAALVAVPASPARATSVDTLRCSDGSIAVRQVFPKSLDTETATDDQLLNAGLPARPKDPRILADWKKYVRAFKDGKVDTDPSCTSASGPIHKPLIAAKIAGTPSARPQKASSNALVPPINGLPTSNWAGNIDNGRLYTNASACWTVPRASGSGVAVVWVGIGLGSSTTYPLVQAGTTSKADGTAYLWTEVFAPSAPWDETEHARDEFRNVAGHNVCIQITFHTDGNMWFHVQDLSMPKNTDFSEFHAGTKPDNHAEFIVERQTGCYGTVCGLLDLANFGTVKFDNARSYQDGAKWDGVGNWSHYYRWISNNGSPNVSDPGVLAFPGPINATGDSFVVDWRRGR